MKEDSTAAFYRAWNERDAEAVVLAFADEGTFVDPLCRSPLSGNALRTHIGSLIAALPEIRFTIQRTFSEGGRAVATWSLRAHCRGALDRELAAEGVSFAIDGVDVLELSDTGIRSMRRLFDVRDLAEKLGLQSIVEPIEVGTTTFGYSLRDWVSKEKPGALGMTWILARDEAEKAVIRGHARKIVGHFHDVPGFIGIITGFAGLHGFTFTLWESDDALQRGTRQGAHREAMVAFRGGLSGGVFTSVWTPARLNQLWTRCANGHANDGTRVDRRCEECGDPLPEREPYV